MTSQAKWTFLVAVGIAAVNVYSLTRVGHWLGLVLAVAFLCAGAIHIVRLRARHPEAVVPVVQWVMVAQIIFGFWGLFADDLESCERALRQRCETPQP